MIELALLLGGLLLGHALAGLVLCSVRSGPSARPWAWIWLVVSLAATVVLVEPWDARWRFVTLTASTFAALKIVVLAEDRSAGGPGLARGAWLLFAWAWVGMQPRAFAVRAPRVAAVRGAEVVRALLVLCGGALLWVLLAWAWRAGLPALPIHVLQLVGVYAALRWGVFPALAHGLATLGIEVGPVFRAPERALTLTDFWSRRWNRPFSEMLQIVWARPLRLHVSPGVARGAGFAASAALHELALSVPVRGGYGLPSLYFLLQALLVARESARAPGVGHTGAWARLRVLALVLLPAALVFHPPFVAGVLAPLLGPRG